MQDPCFPPTCLLSSLISSILRPMKRFTEKKVFSGFTTACRFAICDTCAAVVSPTVASAPCEPLTRLHVSSQEWRQLAMQDGVP